MVFRGIQRPVLCGIGRPPTEDLWSLDVVVLAAATAACGAVSAKLTVVAARQVGVAAPPVAVAWAVCAAAIWAYYASRVGVVPALPLTPAAIVTAPLAVTDWRARRLPDAFTLPAGSATAAAMIVATAVESSSWLLWLSAGSAVGLTLVGRTLEARGLMPEWCAVGSVWTATAASCAMADNGRLVAAVAAGALVTGLILSAHLCGAAGFGDVKITPVVCCAAWAAWDSAGGIWFSSAAAVAVLWLSVTVGGLAATMLGPGRINGVPLGAFLPGSSLTMAVVAAWL